MVETVGCGLRLVGWLVWFVVVFSLFFSPPSDCVSLPSMMTGHHAHTASVLVEKNLTLFLQSTTGGGTAMPSTARVLPGQHAHTAPPLVEKKARRRKVGCKPTVGRESRSEGSCGWHACTVCGSPSASAVELFRFLSLGLELSGDLPPWSVFALTTSAGLSGMRPGACLEKP